MTIKEHIRLFNLLISNDPEVSDLAPEQVKEYTDFFNNVKFEAKRLRIIDIMKKVCDDYPKDKTKG